MKLYVDTNQGVDYISKPLSELITSKGIVIFTNYFGPDCLDFRLTDNLFMGFLQKYNSCENNKACCCYSAYFRYNVRDKRLMQLSISYLSFNTDCGETSGEHEGGTYFIEFTHGERWMLKKLCAKMWMKVFSIHLECFLWRIWDGIHLKRR